MDYLKKYAQLLVQYSLSLEKNERLLIETTTLAEPLVREVYRAALQAGAHPHVQFKFREQERIFWQEAQEQHLSYVNPLYASAMQEFDAYLHIRAPYTTKDGGQPSAAQLVPYNQALKPYRQQYSERTANLSLKRNLCEYPTLANAQNAGLSLEEYQDFIFNACYLYEDDPIAAWQKVHDYQQNIVDYLNKTQHIRYKGPDFDIEFSTLGRIWINSDGKTNMPSGEVYTAPVEDSVSGVVHFSYPSVYAGEEVEGITLWVKDGEIYKWEAKRGKELLDRIFQIEGARRFGEAAIGCNTNIQRTVRNILFDEKIGGTIHMAIGQAYLQNRGKNQSPIHWDMIADMSQGGQIYADGQKVYESGRFLI